MSALGSRPPSRPVTGESPTPTWVSDDGLFVGRIHVTASYDHRDDPDSKMGAGGCILWLILDGPDATMTCTVNTGWVSRPLLGHYARGAGPQHRADKPGVDRGLTDSYPSAGYLGIHAPMQVKDWWQGPGECEWLGVPCYGDGGYLVADTVMAALVAEGHAGAFQSMREHYESWTEPDPDDVADSAHSPTDPTCSTCGGTFDSPPCSLNRDIGWSGHTVSGGVGTAGGEA